MSYNTKNYSENGDKLVIGGTLEVLDGAKLSGFPVAENQAASAATTIADLKADFNSLLGKLKSADLWRVTSVKVSEITVKSLATYLKLDYSGLSEEEILELSTFLQVATRFICDYTGLSEGQLDEHETFVIAVFVLVQDMYDNRSFYVDKSHLNRVVETILGMHSVNLL